MELGVYFADLTDKAEKANPKAEGDYFVDGLLYCGNCHTQKQHKIILLGYEQTVFCLCKCVSERKEAERKAIEAQKKAELIKELRRKAFPCISMGDWTFDNDDRSNERVSDIMRRYTENFDKIRDHEINGVILYGKTGTGKSYFSACVVNALIDRGIPALMTTFDHIRNRLQQSFEGRQDYIDLLAQYPFLVIDDLGAESESEYMQEIIFSVIDARARSGKPLVITTNMTFDELKNPNTERKKRVHSRVLGMCHPIEVVGSDRRKVRYKTESQTMKDIIGL